ncbi:MAG: FecR domain-containing protein [Verrucomicrobiaceae bacterium]|nr:FecR domain-containing protein [Verrucomicrobiaceae bacterium]
MNDTPPDTPQKLSRALDLLIEGELPATEARELQQKMKADPALLSLYLEKVRMESLLRDHAWSTVVAAASFKPASQNNKQRMVSRLWPVLAAAACVALLASLPMWMRSKTASGDKQVAATALPSVQFSATSVFSSATSTVSEDGALQFGDGVIMEDGSVSIRLPSGVEAVLKSPSRFSITGANRLRLDQGAGWFRVPSAANGFAVDLPEMEVVDLGTIFTAQVSEGEHQVQVEEGYVEVRQRAGDLVPHVLKAGEKLIRLASADTVQIVSGTSLLEPAAMMDEAEVVFRESLVHVPDQPFTERKPLLGSWQVQDGSPTVHNGRFAAQSRLTHLMGRFTRAIEPAENAVILVSFKSVSPMSLFHSKGFAGISLFDGDGELFFFGDKGGNSYFWELLTFGKNYRGHKEQRRSHDLAVQGSEETFTLRYRQRTGDFEIFRGRGVQGLPIVKGQTDPGLRFDGVRVANGSGGDFSFDELEVSVVKDSKE